MLELNKINAYYGESHILRDVSFTVSAGEVVCLMGRNGVGKTTTLKVITGLLPARSGDMLFDGSNITKLSTDRRARRGLGVSEQGRQPQGDAGAERGRLDPAPRRNSSLVPAPRRSAPTCPADGDEARCRPTPRAFRSTSAP